MSYSPIDKPTDFFNSVIYTGNGSSPRSITGVGFQPDFNWTKSRSASGSHVLANSVSGATKQLVTNNSSAEATNGVYGYLSAFGSDGWTMTTGSSDFSRMNTNSTTYVSWNWKAGTSFTNDASSTGIGTIDSTGSVSDTAGFSIVSYTGTGSNGTVKHGLSTTPSMMIVKQRNSTENWTVYHSGIGNPAQYMELNSSGAVLTNSAVWNSTNPTSSVFSVGTNARTNNNTSNYIAYCFNDVKGYSKFGSYTGIGNGNNASNADGTFVYTGFKPAFFLVKSTGSFNWLMYDDKRDPLNPNTSTIIPDDSGAEYFPTSGRDVDFLSNGFKMRANYNGNNASGVSFIYMAFAESPFVGSNFVPNNAE